MLLRLYTFIMIIIEMFDIFSIQYKKEWLWLINISLNHSFVKGQTQFVN